MFRSISHLIMFIICETTNNPHPQKSQLLTSEFNIPSSDPSLTANTNTKVKRTDTRFGNMAEFFATNGILKFQNETVILGFFLWASRLGEEVIVLLPRGMNCGYCDENGDFFGNLLLSILGRGKDVLSRHNMICLFFYANGQWCITRAPKEAARVKVGNTLREWQ